MKSSAYAGLFLFKRYYSGGYGFYLSFLIVGTLPAL